MEDAVCEPWIVQPRKREVEDAVCGSEPGGMKRRRMSHTKPELPLP